MFLYVCKQISNISRVAHNSKIKCCYNAKPSAYYFYLKTKISVDFQICISVHLNHLLNAYLGATSLHELFHSNKDSCKCHRYLSCWSLLIPLIQALALFFTNGLPILLAIIFACWLNVKIKHFYNISYNGIIS